MKGQLPLVAGDSELVAALRADLADAHHHLEEAIRELADKDHEIRDLREHLFEASRARQREDMAPDEQAV